MLDEAAVRAIVRQEIREALADPAVRRDDSVSALMTVADVAAFLRTTSKGIYRRVDREQLPGVVRLGGRLYFRRADLLRFVSERRGPSPRSR